MWLLERLQQEFNFIKSLIIKKNKMTPELSAALQALAIQFGVEIKGEVVPVTPVGEVFDFKP